jgi:hypothetical protein
MLSVPQEIAVFARFGLFTEQDFPLLAPVHENQF